MTYFPSRPAKGPLFTMKSTEMVGSSTAMPASRSGRSTEVKVLPISMVSNPDSATMSPAAASSTSTRLQPVEGVEPGHPVALEGLLARPAPAAPSGSSATWSPTRTLPRSMRPIAIRPRKLEMVQRGDQHLERPVGIALGLRHVVQDGLEQRLEVGARLVQLGGGGAGPARGIEERRVQLLVGGLEVDEQAEHLVVHPERLGVGPVDLVDRDDGPEPQGQRLPGDEAGLRHRPLGRVHQDQDPVHHPQDPLDLATEVGVARAYPRC